MNFRELVNEILSEGYFDSADIADIRRSQRADREHARGGQGGYKNFDPDRIHRKGGDEFGSYKGDGDDVVSKARKPETVQDANGNDVTNKNYVKFADDEKNEEHKINSKRGTRVDAVFTSYGKQGPSVKIWSSANKFGNSYGSIFKSGAWIVVPATKMIVVK